MTGNCPECQPFINETERLFGNTLRKYGFAFIKCYGEREGRECRVMYEGMLGRLLFVLGDGVSSCMLGRRNTPFPPFVLLGDKGNYGWYHVVTLAEIATNEILLTKSIDTAILERRLYYYEWQSKLLADHAQQLFSFLDVENEEMLKQEIDAHLQDRWQRLGIW